MGAKSCFEIWQLRPAVDSFDTSCQSFDRRYELSSAFAADASWMNKWLSDNARQSQARPKILTLVHFLSCKKAQKISLKTSQISTGSEKLSPTGWRVFACQWSDLAPIGTLLISIKDTLADLSGHILSFDLIDVKYELDKIFLRVSDNNFRWNTLA